MVSIKNVLFGLLFVAIGLAVAGFAVYTGYMQPQNVNSAVESTEGVIESSTVISDQETEEGETEVEYYPRVSYTYTVDGEELTGERIFSTLDRQQEAGELEGKEYDNSNRAENVAGRYDAGDTVTVYYYPDNPSKSFLVRPTTDWATTIGMGIFGLIFALAGVGAIFSDEE